MSLQDHEPYHLRSIDQQVLDALLRIEKLLASQTRTAAPEVVEEPASIKGLINKRRK
jgi:hypothetical protein